MSNKGLLTVITIILIGIFALIVVEVIGETSETDIGNGVNEVAEEIGDEIDDATTN